MNAVVPNPDRTRADCAARDARVDAMFDALAADFARVFEQIPATARRPAEQRTRAGDTEQAP